jgi:hypothetical protein
VVASALEPYVTLCVAFAACASGAYREQASTARTHETLFILKARGLRGFAAVRCGLTPSYKNRGGALSHMWAGV